MEKIDTGLPLDFHPDGTPIFQRGDFIRPARPMDDGVIYDNLMLPEHKHLRPELRFNMIQILGNLGTEWAKNVMLGKSYPDEKRGFVFGRVIQALDSNCRVILQRWNKPGVVTDFVMLTMQPLQLALVPPVYETILCNASDEFPARFFELHAKEEMRNTDVIHNLEGSGYLLRNDGHLIPNKNYIELPIPRIHPGLDGFKFMQRRPLYEMVTSYPKGFDFIDPPRDEFFVGAI